MNLRPSEPNSPQLENREHEPRTRTGANRELGGQMCTSQRLSSSYGNHIGKSRRTVQCHQARTGSGCSLFSISIGSQSRCGRWSQSGGRRAERCRLFVVSVKIDSLNIHTSSKSLLHFRKVSRYIWVMSNTFVDWETKLQPLIHQAFNI